MDLELINPDLDWTRLLGTQLWQLTLVLVAVGAVARLCHRRHPHLAYVLWLVVLLKAITPPLWASNLSLLGNVPTPRLPSILIPLELPQTAKTLTPSESLPALDFIRTSEWEESSLGGVPATLNWIAIGKVLWLSGAVALA